MRINLIPVEQRPLKQNYIRWQFVVILLGVIILIVISSLGFMKKFNVKALQQQYTAAVEYNAILGLQVSYVKELEQHTQELAQRLNHYEQQLSVSARQSKEMLDLIMLSIPDSVWIEKVELELFQVALQGYTLNAGLVSQFLQDLSKIGFKTRVNDLKELSELSLIGFSITVQRGKSGE